MIYLPSHSVSKKILRSSLLISRTLVSNELCRVRALHRSLASRNARPNSLEKEVRSVAEAEGGDLLLLPRVPKIKGSRYTNDHI